MMKQSSYQLLDLTHGINRDDGVYSMTPLTVLGACEEYVGQVFEYHYNSMVATYLDFPGHIEHLSDGLDAANCPLERLFRVPAEVIHLDRTDGSGAVTASMLNDVAALSRPVGAMIINALGAKRFDEIENRSVWLSLDAVDWVIEQGVRLLISDIYESKMLDGVFVKLFKAGVITVCCPVNLSMILRDRVLATALPMKISGATQLPCRVVAEWE